MILQPIGIFLDFHPNSLGPAGSSASRSFYWPVDSFTSTHLVWLTTSKSVPGGEIYEAGGTTYDKTIPLEGGGTDLFR